LSLGFIEMSIKSYLRKHLPYSFILWTHKVRAILANLIYGFPAKRLKIIGVTGTNGKTTTCNLIAKILEKAGYKVGLLTTINFKIGEKEWENLTKMTTISPFLLQKTLKQMADAKCQYVVLETTSHAIMQYRVWGIKFWGAVLTNITHEHLDYHKTFEDYQKTKLQLFSQKPQLAIINGDDKSAQLFIDQSAGKLLTYGIEKRSDIMAKKIMLEPSGSLFTAVTPTSQISLNLKLPGKFNIYNTLAALSVGVALNVDPWQMKKALEEVEAIPGRMEKVDVGQKFLVIVDYAHTPDALQNIFETLQIGKKGKIISVLGACGDRDKTKRPILGALAGRYADYVIVTNEDPYTEDPWKIIQEVAAGVPRGADRRTPKIEGTNFWKLLDRGEAIAKALSLAEYRDIVLITGKGAEKWMVVGEKKVPWSDQETVKKILTQRR